MLRLRDSSSLASVEAWKRQGASELLAPAPIALKVDAMLPGASIVRRVRLEPGLYVVLCLVPQGRGADGAIVDHAHLGMQQTFVVSP
ncbi:hypothetical protein [Gemmatimonas sp.]|uniref:hypothetical protein n=1 Tax=Gemmatimonas sp. TaxID=1962908 RepID=UPI0035613882